MERVFSPNFPFSLALSAAIATTLMYNDTLDILTLIIGDSAHFPQGLLGKSPEVKLFLQRLSVGGRALHTLFQIHSVLAHHSCFQRWGYNQHCRISCKNQKDALAPPRSPSKRYPLHGSEPPPIFSAANRVQKNVQA